MSEPMQTSRMPTRTRVWRELDRWSYALIVSSLGGIAMVMLALPTVIVLITSFTSAATLRFPPPGFSLQWYHALFFASPEIVDAAFVSLKVATVATIVAAMLATAAAIAITASKASWARAADTMLMSPLLLPSLALGLGLLLTFNLMNVGISLTTLIVGHTVICFPFVLRTTLASLSQIEPVLGSVHEISVRWLVHLFKGHFSACAGWHRSRRLYRLHGILRQRGDFAFSCRCLLRSSAHPLVGPDREFTRLRAAAASGVLIAATVGLMILMERLTGLSRYVR